MNKKALSVILSLLMSVSAFQTPVFAAGEEPEADGQEVTEVQENTEEEIEETQEPEEEEENLEEPAEETPELTEESEETEIPAVTEVPEVTEEPEETEAPEVTEPEEPAEETEETVEDPTESEGLLIAEEEEEEDVVLAETPEEEPEVTLITPEPVTYNGVTVTVSYLSDTFGGKKVTMIVGEPGETEKEALEALGRSFKAVDITFIDEEGNPVQPEEGKNVSVTLEAEDMEDTGMYEAVHVDSEGNVTVMEATSEVTNTVTRQEKVGETTRTVEVPAETETVEVQDYKEETYTEYELKEQTVEIPAVISYRYTRKSREVEVTQGTWGFFNYGKSGKSQTRTEYYYEKEPYVVREAYTYSTWKRVPVQKTRTVPAGTHTETRVVREAYTYEETEDVYEDVAYNDVQTSFEAGSFSVYAVVTAAPTTGEEFVIYSGTTALAYSGNGGLTTASITVENDIVRSGSDNIVWTFTEIGTDANDNIIYRISYTSGYTTRYLRYSSSQNSLALGTYTNNSEWIYDQYNHRLTQGNRYLRYNNNTFTLTTNVNQASAIYLAHVEDEPVPGDLNYYYYNADRTASISASEVAETLTTDWVDVSTLAKEITGYTYLEARANSKDGDVITEVNGRAYRHGTETSGSGSRLDNIYFIYMKDYVAGEDVIPGLNGPVTEKEVTQNPDGTFTITLDVTGVVNEVKHGANVVIVFDRTYSMSGNMSNTDRTMRINAAISAVNTLVTTLNPGDPSIEGFNDIDFALVEFDRNAAVYDFGTNGISGHTNWTKSGSALTTRIERYRNGQNLAASGATQGGGGTNWQAALQATASVLENKPDADPTYVIFMTDGEPTIYIGSDEVHNTNITTSSPEYARAEPYATAIVSADYHMYDIFCSASTTTLLQSLYTTSHADSYVMAETQAAVEQAFANVAQAMIDAIGSSNYGVNDGVPELGSFDINTVDGTLGEARYYKKEANESAFTEWTNAPAATPSSTGVLWDLTSVGTLTGDTVYRIEFEVWPSQAAYDLIADLNNGLRFYDYADYLASNPDPVLTEEAAVTAGLVLTADQRSQITEPASADAEYTMKTNTTLSATYKLYGQTITEDDIDFTADAMDLPVEPISVKKIWPANMLDEYGAADYRDPETGETFTATEIVLTLKRDGQNYMDILVKGSEGWKKDDIFVSNGFMTVETVDGQKVAHIKEVGHDYQLVEPPAFMYYWDLVSDIYHPMVINGVPTLLVYNQDKKAADVDNVTYFAIGQNDDGTPRVYEKHAATDNTLEGSNYRRSNLNLTKVITSGDADALFTYTATVNDSYSTDGYVWFSVWDPAVNGLTFDAEVTGATKETKTIPADATMNDDGTCTFPVENPRTHVITNETYPVAGDGKYYTGYYYATNGATITLKIKATWNVRFLNLYHGSTYSFEETGMPGNFEFQSVEASTQWNFMHQDNADWYEIVEGNANGKITGTITEPNNNYTVKYTNKPKQEFYIYHSGVATDGNLEVIPMTAVNTDGTYDLYAKTTAGTLYGGYYLDYAGKGDYADDGIKGTTGVAYTGMNYEWSNPQTVDGSAMKPVAGETYYIKEVPTYYLRNYHQITYNKTTLKLTGLYLMSAIDDTNYNETGFLLQTTDGKEATVVQTFSITNASGKTVVLKANTIFKSLGITEDGEYLTYWNATGSSYFAANTTFTVKPYWKTPDGILVKGTSTRTIEIVDLTKSGISKIDE
ncbi:MAG: VWA domain-containing protein [Solobacterium sp.]|nr:VWA domain-containing protein [Solobacterium sp.]